MVSIQKLGLVGIGEARRLLAVPRQRMAELLREEMIPFVSIAGRKIFSKQDLAAFQKSRAENMKHSHKK